MLADELKLVLSQPVLSFISSPQIKLVLKKTIDILEDDYTFDKLASAVRTYKSAKTKLSLTPVLRILQSKLNLIGLVCFKQMHLQKMGLDLLRCLVDVNTYLEIACKITDLLLEEMGYGFKYNNMDRSVSVFLALRPLISDEELQCKYFDNCNDIMSLVYCNAARKYQAFIVSCDEAYFNCRFCEGECKCSEYSAHCKYHISICACDVKGDFNIEKSIAELERLFEQSISLKPDRFASRVEFALFLKCEERFVEAVRMAKSAFDIALKQIDSESGHYYDIGEESRVDGNMSRLICYLKFLQVPSTVLSYYIYVTCLSKSGKIEVDKKEFILLENACYEAKGIERDHSLLLLGHTCLIINQKSSAKKHFKQIKVTKENMKLIEQNILICDGGTPEKLKFPYRFSDRIQINFKPLTIESESSNKEASV